MFDTCVFSLIQKAQSRVEFLDVYIKLGTLVHHVHGYMYKRLPLIFNCCPGT